MTGVTGVTGVRFSTRGGPGSVYADLDAIEAVARRFWETGDAADQLAFLTRSAAGDLGAAPRVCGSAALLGERLRSGAARVQRLSDALLTHHEDLRRAAEGYRRAERGAAAVMDAEDPRGEALSAAWAARAADGLSVEDAEFLLRAHAEAAGEKVLALPGDLFVGRVADEAVAALDVRGVLADGRVEKAAGFALASPFGETTADAADLLTDLDPTLRLTPGQVWGLLDDLYALWDSGAYARLQVDGEPVDRPGAPAELTGRLDEIPDFIPRTPSGESGVSVTQVRRPDGRDAWIVGLPGTQDGMVARWGSDNFTDGVGNLDALGNASRRTAPGIAQALAAAGVPPGAELLLTGYSQGGIHAMNLASDPDFSAAYAVRGVLTVGSPNGECATPGDVAALDFATDRDSYTAGDGGPNPVGPWRATVTFEPDGPDEAPALLAPGSESRAAWDALAQGRAGLPGVEEVVRAVSRDMDAAHDLDAYIRMIGDFEDADPAARAEVAGIQAALAGLATGTVVSSRTVRLRRDRSRLAETTRSPRTR